MKNFTPKNKNAFYILSFVFLGLLLSSCTSTQAVYSENDGIYGSSSPARAVAPVQEVPGANYQRYFETEANNMYIGEDEIFTDIDGYIGYSDADEGAVQIEGDYNYGNTPWGYNDSNVSINFHMGFGFGGYWGVPYYGYYNPWYWGYPGYGWGWGYPGFGWGWGYPRYGWGYPGWGWGYPGYGWGYPGYPGYYPPYAGGTYGRRNNYPVRYADNGSRTGYTRTSQAGSTRPNIYKNSVAQNSSTRSTNYRRSSNSTINNSYQRSNQQNSNRNNNSYNRNSSSRPNYSPSMGGSSGYSRGSSSGTRSSSGGRRNGPNVVSIEQGVNRIQSNSKDYRSTGRPVQSDFRNTMNALLSDQVNSTEPVRYEWNKGQARRVNLDRTQRQEVLKMYRDLGYTFKEANRSNTAVSNIARSNADQSAGKSEKVAPRNNRSGNRTGSSYVSKSTSSSGHRSVVSSNRSSSSYSSNSGISSSRSSSSGSGSSYARSSSGGSRSRQ